MSRTYAGVDVLTCVQGNTALAADRYAKGCVVYDFSRRTSGGNSINRTSSDKVHEPSRRTVHDRSYADAAYRKRRIRNRRKKAARARRVMALRACVLAALLFVIFIAGGIVSKAQSRKAPVSYKYYDTITVAYQENLLDIVQRYDNRDYYDTQFDYVEELCRINNISYDGTAYPEIAPGTHLVVPYYSTELK